MCQTWSRLQGADFREHWPFGALKLPTCSLATRQHFHHQLGKDIFPPSSCEMRKSKFDSQWKGLFFFGGVSSSTGFERWTYSPTNMEVQKGQLTKRNVVFLSLSTGVFLQGIPSSDSAPELGAPGAAGQAGAGGGPGSEHFLRALTPGASATAFFRQNPWSWPPPKKKTHWIPLDLL